jgi:hypothetical protein
MTQLAITKNKDQTITVRVGRAIEHISVEGKSKGELFDAVRYAAISKGAVISDIQLTELLYHG